MNTFLISIIFLLLTGLLAVSYTLSQKIKRLIDGKEGDKSMLMLQNQLNDLNKQFNERMREHNKTLQEQMEKSNVSLQKQFGISTKVMQEITDKSSKIVKEVTERLSKLDETNKRVVSFAEQMRSLENILKNPKQRGILGEIFLEQMLSSVLTPNQYKIQYTFESDRKVVDAAVFLDEKILPIDAKFSLELYNELVEETDSERKQSLEKEFKQSIKLRIDETAKYIRLNEATTDFAIMFMPADGIFYNLLSHQVGAVSVNTKNLIEYAFDKKVIIVSPMTFFAYLQTIIQSLNKLQVSKNVDEIMKKIALLGKHLRAYDSYMLGLGKSLETAVNKYHTAYHEFKKVDKDVLVLTEREEGGSIEPLKIVAGVQITENDLRD